MDYIKMTPKMIYDWAVKNGAEDLPLIFPADTYYNDWGITESDLRIYDDCGKKVIGVDWGV